MGRLEFPKLRESRDSVSCGIVESEIEILSWKAIPHHIVAVEIVEFDPTYWICSSFLVASLPTDLKGWVSATVREKQFYLMHIPSFTFLRSTEQIFIDAKSLLIQ